jgi:hypothetical protein
MHATVPTYVGANDLEMLLCAPAFTHVSSQVVRVPLKAHYERIRDLRALGMLRACFHSMMVMLPSRLDTLCCEDACCERGRRCGLEFADMRQRTSTTQGPTVKQHAQEESQYTQVIRDSEASMTLLASPCMSWLKACVPSYVAHPWMLQNMDTKSQLPAQRDKQRLMSKLSLALLADPFPLVALDDVKESPHSPPPRRPA